SGVGMLRALRAVLDRLPEQPGRAGVVLLVVGLATLARELRCRRLVAVRDRAGEGEDGSDAKASAATASSAAEVASTIQGRPARPMSGAEACSSRPKPSTALVAR